jgi:hypothetical protein
VLMPGARAGLACTCAGVDKEHIKSIDLVRHIAGAGVRGADIFNKRSPALPSLLSLHVHLGRLHGWLPRSTCILAHHAGTRFLAHMHTCFLANMLPCNLPGARMPGSTCFFARASSYVLLPTCFFCICLHLRGEASTCTVTCVHVHVRACNGAWCACVLAPTAWKKRAGR